MTDKGVPRQRGDGETGGHGGQRENKSTFRNNDGNVPPVRRGTSSMVVAAIAAPIVAAAGYLLIPLF
jgi:hypothetical protein